MNQNSEMETGSARGPRAGLGGPPKPSCPRSNLFSRAEKLVERSFRRAAENCTPAACAPHAAAPRAAGAAEFGINLARKTSSRRSVCGALHADLLAALFVLVVAMIPLAIGFVSDQKILRAHYHHAVAMEIVDGEMEILVAGEWRAQPEGPRLYEVKAAAAKNLPPGKFTLTRTGPTLRLEWAPDKAGHGGHVVREAVVK